ncbi:MAG: triose-phosphate isomerase [Patescibacteria group bacterium]
MKKQDMSRETGSATGGRKVIIANWKMNLSVMQSLGFIKKIVKSKNEVVIAAPYTFLCELGKHLKQKKIKLAGQNVSQFDSGAYTGDVSAKMLKEEGCAYCLVGHSERRIYFNEKDKEINKKIIQLLKYKIRPVLCIGESSSERAKGLTAKVLNKQLKLALTGIKKCENILIAYEPIWAISTFVKCKTKCSARMSDITAAHQEIKKMLKVLYPKKFSKIKILYGGTVNEINSKDIFKLPLVDGVLVGGASLNISSFNAIIKSS